jgi:hypothetical protein
VRLDDAVVRLEPDAFAAAGRDPREFARALAADFRRVPGVMRADLTWELAAGDTVNDAVTRRWLHMLPPDLPYYLAVTLSPGFYWGSRAPAQHGTPHDSDAHVPLIFYGTPFRPGQYSGFARTADIAPTLARVLRVNPTEPLDGHALAEALR